jgi:4-hydroxybenzoate polyprenyltransferase
LRALILAAHPLPTAGVTGLSAGLAALAGLNLHTGALFTAAVLAGQLSIGWSNDWIDAGRDKVAGRTDNPWPAARSVLDPLRWPPQRR